MDLRSIINDEGGRPTPQQATPVTPVQAPPQQAFREYGYPTHASPNTSKHPSQDYGQPPNVAYSPKTYQGGYQGRPPPPPPIQAPPQNVLQSPIRSYSAQSPYQQTPSSTVSAGQGQYPFPPSHHQTPQSPAQHQSYPPSFQQRDSYPHSNPPAQTQHPYPRAQASPAPQTPPVGLPGGPNPYLQHQRSQSSVSNSTPNSAQSQAPPYNPYPRDSPVVSHQYPPPPSQHSRQQSQHSQPGTPLGPPLAQRQSSGGFVQPSSPYQQRANPPGSFSQYQTSPAPVTQRLPSTPNPYEAQRPSIAEQQHRRSQSERERSLSVSPKTRLPSQPTIDMSYPQQQEMQNPTKRKMDDREVPIEIPRHVTQPEVIQAVNGDHKPPSTSSASPQPPSKKRTRYTEPPIWARSVRAKGGASLLGNRGPPNTNGRPIFVAAVPVKAEVNGHQQPPEVNRGQPPKPTPADADPSAILGPWEYSVTGVRPVEELSKQTADFIFANVVSRGDLGELASRGVEVEIEAKLGQFMDSGERVSLGVMSECVMVERRQNSFRSAMTEHQHKVMNDFLNAQVADAHPKNPDRSKKRVNIVYVHRREIDKFYDLPPSILASLPPAIAQQQGLRSARLRVTHDQKTGQILAKIIKVRIADMSIHFPRQPLDCRISINFEMKYDGDVESIIEQSQSERHNDRTKDRLSYTHGHYQIDLTQVTKVKPHNGIDYVEKEHELEIEVDTKAILDQGNKARTGQPHEYLALVEGLVNNIRVLARNVPPS